MKIYLIKKSQFNEDHILAGYVTDEESIKNLVRDYNLKYYRKEPENITVHWSTLEVMFLCDGFNFCWYLVELEPYNGNVDEL